MVHAVGPAGVDVGMALEAIAVVVQRLGGDELARGRSRQRGVEILFSLGRADGVPAARIGPMEFDHGCADRDDDGRIRQPARASGSADRPNGAASKARPPPEAR